MAKLAPSPIRLFILVLATLAAPAGVLAQRIAPSDPGIGSYYYFVALDRRCPVVSAERNVALEKFKKHYTANARAIFSGYPGSVQQEVFAKLDRLEREGPTNDELAPFQDFINGASPAELGQACASAPREIQERMEMETKMGEAARKLNERVR